MYAEYQVTNKVVKEKVSDIIDRGNYSGSKYISVV